MAPPWELPMVEAQKQAAADGNPIPGGIPAAPAAPRTGTELIDEMKRLPASQWQDFMVQKIKEGHIPDFLRDLHTVQMKVKDANGAERTIEYEVMPDYMAIGTDEDYLIVPMSGDMAQQIAVAYGMSPPTALMVDQIAAQGAALDVGYTKRDPPDPDKSGSGYAGFSPYSSKAAFDSYVAHQQVVTENFSKAVIKDTGTILDPNLTYTHGDGEGRGYIAVNHMKDIVMSEQVTRAADAAEAKSPSPPGKGDVQNDKLGLYHPQVQGGHGKAEAARHFPQYSDYSQGLRLVSPIVTVDGTPMHISEVLSGKDPSAHLHPLLSKEGAMDNPALYADR
jgi:hypothetical protein